MDISADLTELGKTPMSVVCAGPKAILDIPRTLEYLETQGVPVCTLGPPGSNVPSFYSRDSGQASNYCSTLQDVADIISECCRNQAKGRCHEKTGDVKRNFDM